MTRHHYAHHNQYGVGTVYQRPDGTIDRLPGQILRFASKASRDAWVSAEQWNDGYRREPVPATDVCAVIDRARRRWGNPAWMMGDDGLECLTL